MELSETSPTLKLPSDFRSDIPKILGILCQETRERSNIYFTTLQSAYVRKEARRDTSGKEGGTHE
jgi:hypothetical protein